MADGNYGKVVSLALRTSVRGPMKEIPAAQAVPDGGLEGDIPVEPDRGITFISSEQWADVTAELQADLPWYTRRANVLVSGLVLSELKGHRIQVGEAEVLILDETAPCGLMDRQHTGLRKALLPDWRGGVYGRVVRGGLIRTGDAISVCA